MKNIVILGSTGSVGVQTLDIVRAFSDELNVVGLVANNNIQLLNKQIAEFQPNFINFNQQLISSIELQGSKHENNINIISNPIVDIIVVATPSLHSLEETLEALKIGKTIALASKEIIVSAQSLLDEIITYTSSNRFGLDIELIYFAIKRKYKIYEVWVKWKDQKK